MVDKVGMRKWLFSFIINLFLIAVPGLQAKEIVIIGINDAHAHMERVAAFASRLKAEREKTPELVLVGAGDIFAGREVMDYDNTPEAMVELMNLLEMDAATFGNHEFDYGDEELFDYVKAARFPFVCANCTPLGGETDVIHPYTIIERDGVKIGIIGLVETSDNGKPYIYSGYNPELVRFSSPFESMANFAYLRAQCDILVALSHLGYEADCRLAHLFPELDAIIGAHSHIVLPDDHMKNGVLIAQSGFALTHYSRLEFTVEDGEVKAKRGYSLCVGDSVEDQTVARYVESCRASAIKLSFRQMRKKMIKYSLSLSCVVVSLLMAVADFIVCRMGRTGA